MDGRERREIRGIQGWSRTLRRKRWIDEGVFLLKGQVFRLQLLFYILCSETEEDRGTMTYNEFAKYHSMKMISLQLMLESTCFLSCCLYLNKL